jgi:hypothetical protein
MKDAALLDLLHGDRRGGDSMRPGRQRAGCRASPEQLQHLATVEGKLNHELSPVLPAN